MEHLFFAALEQQGIFVYLLRKGLGFHKYCSEDLGKKILNGVIKKRYQAGTRDNDIITTSLLFNCGKYRLLLLFTRYQEKRQRVHEALCGELMFQK